MIRSIEKCFESICLLTGLFLILLWIHVFCLWRGVNIPILLLYGPFLYCVYEKNLNRFISIESIVYHLIPSILLGCFFFKFHVVSHEISTPLYMLSVLFSLAYYSFSILFHSSKRKVSKDHIRNVFLTEKLAMLGLSISFFWGLIFLNVLLPQNFEVDPKLMIILLLWIAIGLVIWNQYSVQSDVNSEKKLLHQENQGGTLPEEIEKYSVELHQIMKAKRLFLNANLSQQNFYLYVDIPIHHLNYLIRNDFEEWIAKYRIAYATELLNQEKYSSKLNSISNLCGFSSQALFIKYFKKFNGMSPSEYRSKMFYIK